MSNSLVLIFILNLSVVCLAMPQQKLKRYSIDKSKITVSGVSSGAAMASQMHIAYSSIISGSGSVAGPPYYCANGLLNVASTVCMNSIVPINLNILTNNIKIFWQNKWIDNPDNLKKHNAYLFSGTKDTVVSQYVVKKSEELYLSLMDASRIKTVYSLPAVHAMITNFYGKSCSIKSENYLNNCNYNQAYDILKTVYPSDYFIENTKIETTGTYIEFDQTEFFSINSTSFLISMDSTGYVYVPKNCTFNNSNCKLHIAFHGCSQGHYKIGHDFIHYAGYNQIADLNNIIIMYPQAISNAILNPYGCWDWWGYSGVNYANKNGIQMRTIKAMIDRIIL